MEAENRGTYAGIVLALSDALDLVSSRVVGHHKRVASLAAALAAEMGLPPAERSDIVMAAALHDCGAFTLRTRLDILEFDMINPHEHAERGYRLLMSFPPFEYLARLVRYHHVPWENGIGGRRNNGPVPHGSRILHLADRVSILIDPQEPVLEQKTGIVETVNRSRGSVFEPGVADAFNAVADREHVWLDAASGEMPPLLAGEDSPESVEFGRRELNGLAGLFLRLVDYRSPYTATHSSGVRACAGALAELCGFSEPECGRMETAASLHDLGKLAVPAEILDKAGALNHYERSIVRSHPYFSYRILERIPTLSDISAWASFHHERLDGHGYPFHVDGARLSTGCRVISLADVFTAVTEERPYRRGMSEGEALGTLESMGNAGKLDGEIVSLVKDNYEQLDALRAGAQEEAGLAYRSLVGRAPTGRA